MPKPFQRPQPSERFKDYEGKAKPFEFRLEPEQFAVYKAWKESVPAPVRSLVEGAMMGKTMRVVVREEYPSVAEFYRGMKELFADPSRDPSTLDMSHIVQKQLAALTPSRLEKKGKRS